MKLSSSNRLLVKNNPHSEPALFSTSAIPLQDSCHDANCTWRSFTTRAFCNSLLHIRDGLECLKTNILPVPRPSPWQRSITSQSLSAAVVRSPSVHLHPGLTAYTEGRKENMKEPIKHEASELSLVPAECKVLSEIQLNLILWCSVLPTGKVILSTRCGFQ